ncbi:YopX family protein [Bacillus cereus group sp. BfR-BA-01424]|uniref:YopX family protein n=1 Tax=Bacillus cereus group sp. BfR-BA-01424 TaxID=2920341 RepID=UPI001F58B9AE
MREIKFRAWDKEFKQFSDTALNYKIADINYYTDYEWMQYTGLKDKNGKEIYEGDIVEYDGWFYIIKWDEEEAGFYMHDKNNFEDDHLRMIDISVGEVMGNIYENENLIK